MMNVSERIAELEAMAAKLSLPKGVRQAVDVYRDARRKYKDLRAKGAAIGALQRELGGRLANERTEPPLDAAAFLAFMQEQSAVREGLSFLKALAERHEQVLRLAERNMLDAKRAVGDAFSRAMNEELEPIDLKLYQAGDLEHMGLRRDVEGLRARLKAIKERWQKMYADAIRDVETDAQ